MKLLDYLILAVAIVTALVVYHVRVVEPLERQCVRRVYVVDLDGMVARARKEVVDAALNGRTISSGQAVDEVKRRLEAALRGVPKGSLVLDRSAVIEGGTAIGHPQK